MNLERFQAERSPDWEELDRLLGEARGRPERLPPERMLRLGARYRAVAADLALARRRFGSDPVVRHLEQLVSRARFVVYDVSPTRSSLTRFLVRGYWRRVLERPWPLAVAALLLFGPAALATAWGLTDPAAATGLVPEQFRAATDPGPEGTDLGLTPAEEAAFSSQVLTNNIQVTFMAFAAGIALGLGTAVVLVYNGMILGTIAGLTAEAGNLSFFIELVAAHGVLELSCIVVAGAAGLRLGWAIVEPGRLSRGASLVREGRRSVEIVLGTAPWLVLAGVVEGFVSRGGLAAGPSLAVGIPVGALYWGLVVWRGRAGDDEATEGLDPGAQSRARALAVR